MSAQDNPLDTIILPQGGSGFAPRPSGWADAPATHMPRPSIILSPGNLQELLDEIGRLRALCGEAAREIDYCIRYVPTDGVSPEWYEGRVGFMRALARKLRGEIA